ncbi:hypothetical protein SESBI_14166 [Sesbania bispinosa]|nr:hypothetical protein SESBI_14166 [Sesbania bispinosa]
MEVDGERGLPGVAGSGQSTEGRQFVVVPENVEGDTDNVVVHASSSTGDDVVPVRKVKGKKKVADGGAPSKPAVIEKKCASSGLLRGYILKVDSKEKDEGSYDFVNYSWVDPSIMETSSVYRSSEETVAFTEENDFVRKDFQGTVECSWCSDDDSHPGRKLLEALTSSYKKFKDHFFRLWSEEGTVAFYKDKDGCDTFPLYWSLCPHAILGVDPSYFSEFDLAEIRYLENRVSLKCLKLIELEGEPKRLKNILVWVKMSPKLEESAMARRIAEKKREAAKEEKTGKNVNESEVHNISDDENRVENIVDVFQEFTGSSPEIRSLWNSRFEFRSMIDASCSLPGDQSQLDKWGARSAHVMLQIQGIRSAFLGRYLELQHVKGLSEVDTLRKKSAQNEALVETIAEKVVFEGE